MFSTKSTESFNAWSATTKVVGYSRIYLGVHYPFDIVGGMLWAIIVSLLTYKFLSLKIDETIQ